MNREIMLQNSIDEALGHVFRLRSMWTPAQQGAWRGIWFPPLLHRCEHKTLGLPDTAISSICGCIMYNI